MKKDERLYLNDLSKKLYGSSSKWQKMILQGQPGLQIKEIDGVEIEYKGFSYYTVDEIKTTMEELWKEEQELKAAQEKEALELKAKTDTVKEILETVES